MSLVSVSYAECRRKFFEKLKRHEENRLKYWAREAKGGYLTEKAEFSLYDAGDNISFLEDAIDALERYSSGRGNWENSEYHGFLRCSICKDAYVDEEWVREGKWGFCPHCGAKMDLEVE